MIDQDIQKLDWMIRIYALKEQFRAKRLSNNFGTLTKFDRGSHVGFLIPT